jgi:hypothetical protein
MMRALVLMSAGLFSLGVWLSQAQPAESEHVSEGEVISVDATTLTVRETRAPDAGAAPDASRSGVVRKFVVDGSTKLANGQQSIELSEVRVGDNVIIRFVLDKGENVAKRVEVQSKETELR